MGTLIFSFPLNPPFVCSLRFVLVSILFPSTKICTELITNNAAAALATPIAFNIADKLNVRFVFFFFLLFLFSFLLFTRRALWLFVFHFRCFFLFFFCATSRDCDRLANA